MTTEIKDKTGYQFSYWEKDSFLKPFDLVVVGAGIVGLATAYFYKEKHPGDRVLVLDKGFIPQGASTRNAGFACIGSITEHVSDFPAGSEKLLKERLKMRYNGLQSLRKHLGDEEIGYRPCGGYELFVSKEKFEKAEKHISTFNGWLEELTDEDDVYRPDTLNGYPVIHNRLEGALHPGKMIERLINLNLQRGVQIKWNTQVIKTDAQGKLQLENGMKLTAGALLIASNGFTKKIMPDISIQPARGLILITNRLSTLPWKGTFHHDRGYIYFRDIDGRLLIGGARSTAKKEEETYEFGTNPSIRQYLIDFTNDVLQLEPGWAVDHEWSGIMGFTENKIPVLKKIDEKRVVAAGLSGMGIAIGMEMGEKASSLLAG